MLLVPIRSPHQGMYFAPFRLPHNGMYLAPITSQHMDILHQSQRFGIVFLQIPSWIRGFCKKNNDNQNFWAHLISVTVFGLRERLID